MSGWVPMPVETWPLVAEALPKPWSREAACFDLRWRCDQGEKLSRRKLAEAWGWGPNRVRTLLRNPDAWWDSAKGEPPRLASPRASRAKVEAPSEHPVSTQSAPSEHPVSTQSEKGEAGESAERHPRGTHGAPSEHPQGTQGPPHAFYPQPQPPSQPQPQGQSVPKADRTPDEWQQLADLWNDLAKVNGGGVSRLTRSKGLGLKLKARQKDHGHEAMASLLRWYWTSQHDRARFLREKQVGLKTLLRPDNCEEYVAFASAERPKPQRPASADSSRTEAMRARARQQLRSRIAAKSEVPDG